VRDLPTGTVTFLFTDVEGSTRLIQALGDRFVAVHQEHQRLIRTAIATHDGREVSTEGDSFFVVFEDAASGVAATGQIHRGLAAAAWPSPDAVVRVRAGLHTGQGIRGGDNYLGLDVNRAARISAAGHGGQTLLSDATATAAREGLGTLHAGLALRDLGRHRLRDVGVERLWQLDVEGLPTEFAPLRSLEAHPSNLPAEPTPLVDRGAERAYVRGLLDSAAVVTVTGPGGIGKTRVALAVAHDLLPAMPDGVFHVDAAAIENADRLADELATVAGVRIAPGQDAATALEEHLRTRMVLLVVDTLDRVSGAPAFVARLAAACPGVRLLVTSRSPLHIAAERDVPLEPLPSDAGIALFVDRAAAIRPGFELSAANAAAIAEICARLDGVPLALELAAARLRLLSPDALLARLTSRLGLLTGGTADAPDRQRTLRATIDWSVEALSEGDRRALARLSVFAATFDLDAAEAILGDPEALDALSRLVDQSVVVAVPGDTPRFRLLGSMREFAAEALAALGETEAARRAHADWVGGAVDAATPELEGAGDLDAVARLDAILDELRAALDWLLGPGADPAGALEIAAGLGRFWWLRGRPREGRAWLERTLDALPAGTSGGEAVRADALYWSGVLADEERMPAVAKERLAEALALRRAMGDERGIARTLNSLGAVARSMGQLDQAETLLGESLERKRTLGDGRGMAATLSNLGLVAADRDDLALAHARFEQALALDRASGERGAETYSLLNLGGVKIWMGDVDPGVAIVREALGVLADLDDADGVAEAVEHLALASRARGDLETAARLLFAARQVRARAGAPLREIDARRVDSAFAAVRAALPAELLQSLEAEAAALDEAAAAALALSTVKVAGSAA
jgi:predicted ATPase/class 3 adenylate cyclase